MPTAGSRLLEFAQESGQYLAGMSSTDWAKALDVSQIERLKAIMRQLPSAKKLPYLDQALCELLCSAFPGAKKLKLACDMMDIYDYDGDGFARSLLEAEDLVVRYFADYAPVLKRCKWFEMLSPSKRYVIAEKLIKKRTASKCVALAEVVGSAVDPKRLFVGNLVKMRRVIEQQAGLKTMSKAGKDACSRLNELLK